jgi:phosphatidylcholine synthase
MSSKSFSPIQKALAWLVHIFTASGLVAGFMAILAINEMDWRMAMFWLFIALVIDGIDGTFARMFKVKEVLPQIDGKTIDFVVDFATYAIIPAYFFYSAELAPEAWNLPCTSLILIVSALYYGKDGMVSTDMYFIGFPVLWNLVIFYLVFVFQASPMINVLLIFVFSIMHFLPIKFAYPSQASRFQKRTLLVSTVFFIVLLSILYLFPERNNILTILAWGCGLYFGFLAIYNTYFEQSEVNKLER